MRYFPGSRRSISLRLSLGWPYGWPGLLVSIWFAVKFVAVILMTGFHYWLKARMRDFQADNNKISERNYRFANEIPTVLMIIIVVMVIVKPF